MSTCDPLVRLLHEADFALHSGNITVAIQIDFSKAFDLLWVDGLLLKMMKLNISGNLLRWTKNFLSHRTYRVQVGDAPSQEYTTVNGTPQGSSYSPLLFLILVNDFPKLSSFTSDAFFADDCTIWRSGMNLASIIFHLQQDLAIIAEWCNKWGFIINSDKTIGIVFTNQKVNIDIINLKINGNSIKFNKNSKLLGINLDSHLT